MARGDRFLVLKPKFKVTTAVFALLFKLPAADDSLTWSWSRAKVAAEGDLFVPQGFGEEFPSETIYSSNWHGRST